MIFAVMIYNLQPRRVTKQVRATCYPLGRKWLRVEWFMLCGWQLSDRMVEKLKAKTGKHKTEARAAGLQYVRKSRNEARRREAGPRHRGHGAPLAASPGEYFCDCPSWSPNEMLLKRVPYACSIRAWRGRFRPHTRLVHTEIADLVLQGPDADMQELRCFGTISARQCKRPGNGGFFGALLEPPDSLLQVSRLHCGLGG